MLAWLYGVGQDSGWPQPLQLQLLGLLAGCAEASRQNPALSSGHILLAGLFVQFEALKPEIGIAFAQGPQLWREQWTATRPCWTSPPALAHSAWPRPWPPCRSRLAARNAQSPKPHSLASQLLQEAVLAPYRIFAQPCRSRLAGEGCRETVMCPQ